MMRGSRLGLFRIESELGSGGMGRVFSAIAEGPLDDVAAGSRVALKVIHPHLLSTTAAHERFLREIKIGSAVRHPNVVRTYAGGSDGEHHYLAMEYVEGQTLRGVLSELTRVPEELCRHVGREVASGLAAIHAAGAIHRDIKPENILITPDHVVKIMDLGVARLADEAVRLSRTGAFVGSLAYAAPEQLRGGGNDLDGRVDLHALGLVLYELAGGGNPYDAEDFAQVIRRVLQDEPRRVGEVSSEVTPFFEDVVETLLSKDREDRFATAEEVVAILDEGEKSEWYRARVHTMRSETWRSLRRIRIPRETPLYGRDAEMETMRTLLRHVKSGEGRVLLIEGEEGIGKSRLVDEFVDWLQREGEEIDFLYGAYPPPSAVGAPDGFRMAFGERFGEEGSARYLNGAAALVPQFDAFLRGEPAPDGATVDPATIQRCLVLAARALAATTPTILLLDDLHLAPREGLAIFTALARALADQPVLLIGTMQRGLPADWLAELVRRRETTQMSLTRLSPEHIDELLQDALRSERLARTLGREIAAKSDGNPFFVFEILRGLRDAGFLVQRPDGSWASTREIERIRIPSSVLELVQARLAEVADDERPLLDVAACCGLEFDPLLIGEVLDVQRIGVLRMLGRIERKSSLVRASGRDFAFDHSHVQEVLYEELSVVLREEYHLAIAAALQKRMERDGKSPDELTGQDASDLAHHYLESSDKHGAAPYVTAALSHLPRGWLFERCLHMGRRALSVPGLLSDEERLPVLRSRAICMAILGRQDEERAALEEALRVADRVGDHAAGAELLQMISKLFMKENCDEMAVVASELAVERGRSAQDALSEAKALEGHADALTRCARHGEAKEAYEKCVEMARERGDLSDEARLLNLFGASLTASGRAKEATRIFEQTFALSRGAGNTSAMADAAWQLGRRAFFLGRLEDALSFLNQASDAAVKADQPRDILRARLAIAAVRTRLGDRKGAVRAAGLAQTGALELGSRSVEALSLGVLGVWAFRDGDSESADRRFSAALAMELAPGDRIPLLDGYATVLLDMQREVDARAALLEVLDMAPDANVGTGIVPMCRLATLPLGDTARAQRMLLAHEDDIPLFDRVDARVLLWRATDDLRHRGEARRLFDETLPHVPSEWLDTMRANVPSHRDLLVAPAATATVPATAPAATSASTPASEIIAATARATETRGRLGSWLV